jgi:hypothetical protein
MLVDVIKGVKQRSDASFIGKESGLTVKKSLCYRLKRRHRERNIFSSTETVSR